MSGCTVEVEPVRPEDDGASWGGAEDPFLSAPYLSAHAQALGGRAVVARARAGSACVSYALLLFPTQGGKWLARTPDYGGPRLGGTGSLSASGWSAVRCAFDRAFAAEGIVSEVALLGPWLPARAVVACAWAARPSKAVVVVGLPLEDGRLSHGRRDDLRRCPPAEVPSPRLLDETGARRFGERYLAWQQDRAVDPRWRLGADYFIAVARSGRVLLSEHVTRDGGAAALFLVAGPRAAYLFATRWGKAPGASSGVLWSGASALTSSGVTELVLGGGVSDTPDDPLLRFKMSWGGRAEEQLVGARCYDPAAQEAAERDGTARALPAGWVRA